MKRLCLFLFILLGVVAKADKLPIWNLSQGLVKAAAPALVAEGQAIELRDFMFTTQGALTPRWGYAHIGGSFGPSPSAADIWGLLPYNRPGLNKILLLYESPYPTFAGLTGGKQQVLSVFAGGTNDTVKSRYWYNPHRFKSIPITGAYSSHYLNNLIMGSANSELRVYDGTKVFDARPRGPGQLHATPIDSAGGNVTGEFIYKYTYRELIHNWHSNMSLPSFPVSVVDGMVILSGFATPIIGPDTMDQIYVFRNCVTDTNGWGFCCSFDYLDTVCVDSIAYTPPSVNTFDYEWGPWSSCYAQWYDCGSGVDSAFCPEYLRPPGAVKVTLATHTGIGVADLTDSTPYHYTCQSLEYAVVFVDSCGRHSYPSPTYCLRFPPVHTPTWDPDYDSLKAEITNIMPEEPHNIVKKLILRRQGLDWLGLDSLPDEPEDYDGFYLIATLDDTTTTYTDTLRSDSMILESDIYCTSGGSAITPDTCYDPAYSPVYCKKFISLSGGYTPDEYDCVDDSVISFRPTDVILHNRRMFAIGNPDDLNKVYYSKIGYPTNWAYDNFIGMPSYQGDWFVRLYELGENLVLFRQNSIVLLSGLTFYQFRTIDVKSKVGATAPQSVTGDESHVYFLHESGVHEMVIGQVPTKISQPIQTYLDSLNLNQLRGCVGAMVNGEYWLSHPDPKATPPQYNNSRTLIYNPALQNWRLYTFGFQAMVNTNLDTDSRDFNPSTYVFARNDSLFQLSDTLIEDVGVVVPATFQTGVLFAQPGRVKVNYIDFDGIGTLDSIQIFVYENSLNLAKTKPGGGAPAVVDTISIIAPSWSGFSARQQIRARVDWIAKDFSFKIICFKKGSGSYFDYKLYSITVDYTPWDEGRVR